MAGAGAIQRVAVLGAGAWGTALAAALQRAGREVLLWSRRAELAEEINRRHANPDYLPNVSLDAAIRASGDLAEAAERDALLLVTPAQHLRRLCRDLAGKLKPGRPLVICSKGIEQGSLALMTEAAAEALPGQPLAVLSGPNFAKEVAAGLPAATTLAASDEALARALVEALGSRSFRPYVSDDPVGAQVGGAVKNVIAIACGIVTGRRLGDNARAALITRGLAEVVRLGVALGARPETLMGLSGLGDLTLTCSAMQSRNYSLGVALGHGERIDAVLGARRSVAEGVFSAAAVAALAERQGVEMPICAAVDRVVNAGADLDETIAGLLNRPFTSEHARP
ncbi:MAG: NAD(P)H-dependent glycerol-3-phosphate dehydrogenase [Kiloniellales bacterium]|nr:NAD(P)H-dependent glycerol-3-phosphate dehydrogenase [Kiloniellales bacterium]